ncbi:unnamed protein product [Heterobilharzia americana]|nr:unnamed protein product [Heterobilharzia americana]
MSNVQLHLKPLDENICDQYQQLLAVNTELSENFYPQELTTSSQRSNNLPNNNTFVSRNRTRFIGLMIIITCCVVFPTIYFMCYTAMHCKDDNEIHFNESYKMNKITSKALNEYILNHFANSFNSFYTTSSHHLLQSIILLIQMMKILGYQITIKSMIYTMKH